MGKRSAQSQLRLIFLPLSAASFSCLSALSHSPASQHRLSLLPLSAVSFSCLLHCLLRCLLRRLILCLLRCLLRRLIHCLVPGTSLPLTCPLTCLTTLPLPCPCPAPTLPIRSPCVQPLPQGSHQVINPTVCAAYSLMALLAEMGLPNSDRFTVGACRRALQQTSGRDEAVSWLLDCPPDQEASVT